jgi:hypothetical protein
MCDAGSCDEADIAGSVFADTDTLGCAIVGANASTGGGGLCVYSSLPFGSMGE